MPSTSQIQQALEDIQTIIDNAHCDYGLECLLEQERSLLEGYACMLHPDDKKPWLTPHGKAKVSELARCSIQAIDDLAEAHGIKLAVKAAPKRVPNKLPRYSVRHCQ